MKKIIISTILCCGLLLPVAAQEAGSGDPIVNKQGIALLPQAGDFAMGIDATPFLRYAGNMLNGNTGNAAPTFGNNTIYGKYFLTDKTAVRAKLHLDFTEVKNKQTIADDHAKIADPTNVTATAVDVKTTINRGLSLNLGYELRRGKGRVQGFYGGEFRLGYFKDKTKYDYANEITSSNSNPTTHDFDGNTSPLAGSRVLNNNYGATWIVGLGGFAGVEYFFAPQISIGGELGLNFNYSIKGQNEITTEGTLNGARNEWTYRNRKQGETALRTGIETVASGAIFLLFHF